MTKPKGPRSPISDDHKEGMHQGRTVRRYLEALLNSPPPRKRQGRSAADLAQALRDADDPMERLLLRPQLRAALEAESFNEPLMKAQAEFIKIVKPYSERMGLTYGDWREEGVPAAVLTEGGLSRAHIKKLT